MWKLSSEQLAYTVSIRTSRLNIPIITRTRSGATTGIIRTGVVLVRDETCTDMISSERAVFND
jgi:hypothetical protein